jgi:hypothetical protein
MNGVGRLKSLKQSGGLVFHRSPPSLPLCGCLLRPAGCDTRNNFPFTVRTCWTAFPRPSRLMRSGPGSGFLPEPDRP